MSTKMTWYNFAASGQLLHNS